jgi:hypothetical protein
MTSDVCVCYFEMVLERKESPNINRNIKFQNLAYAPFSYQFKKIPFTFPPFFTDRNQESSNLKIHYE